MDKRLLAEARKARLGFMLSIALQVLAAVCLLGQAYALSQAIARAFLQQASLQDIGGLLLAAAGLALARAGLTWAANLSAAQVSIRVRLDLRKRLLEHITGLGAAFTQGKRTSELVTAAVKGIDVLEAYFRDYVPAVFAAALVPLTVLAAVLPLDLLTFVILLVTAPLIPLFMALIGMAAGALARTQYAQLGRLSAHFLDVMQGLATLKLFNRSRYQVQVVARISDEFRLATMGVLRVAFLSALALEMLATLSVAIVAVEIGIRLLYGNILFDQALFLLIIAPEFYLPLRTLGARFHTGTEAAAAAARIFDVLEMPLPSLPAAPQPAPTRMHIRFEGVRFTYPGADQPALNGLSLEVLPGQRVALVGASGGGKSTAAALLMGFLRPEAGRISINGTDLASLEPEAWRARLAWVPQQPYLFNASVAHNIRLGRPDAPLEAVIEAARAAEAHSFITALPQGYDTPIGERGARLSGGQAQRVAIARAFLKDAPLLVLDEFSSYLDEEAEAAVQAALRRLMQGRTALMIAHRLATIRDADRIIVIGAGQAIEAGTHAQLLARGGAYQALMAAREQSAYAH